MSQHPCRVLFSGHDRLHHCDEWCPEQLLWAISDWSESYLLIELNRMRKKRGRAQQQVRGSMGDRESLGLFDEKAPEATSTACRQDRKAAKIDGRTALYGRERANDGLIVDGHPDRPFEQPLLDLVICRCRSAKCRWRVGGLVRNKCLKEYSGNRDRIGYDGSTDADVGSTLLHEQIP
jgi:hypothetical protein